MAVFIFQDYGLSRDEPLFYAYADAVGYAYSIPEHLSDEFNIEQAYGPSATDHKMYGPAYLLLGRNPVNLLSSITGLRKPEFWHLVNFLTFLIGGALLYDLCKRWMSELAAFGAMLLFITQPVLWGHAFINPKDIPFMVFMLAALSLGLKMVDHLVQLSNFNDIAKEDESEIEDHSYPQKTWLILSIVLFILFLLVLLFDDTLRVALGSLIRQAYDSPESNVLGKVFEALAMHAADIPVEAYINKGLAQFERFRTAFFVISIPLILISTAAAFRPPFVMHALRVLKDILAPLPTKPLLWIRGQKWSKVFTAALIPGILLGLVTSIRVTGPIAGLLVLLYFFLRSERRSLAGMIIYALIALAVSYLTWPFLWDAPLQRFIEVIQHMSNNPHILPVLFNGDIFPSNQLPASYLPVMLGITLTIPVLPILIIGLVGSLLKIIRRKIDWRSLLVVFFLFLFFLAYVILLSPPVYDGYRHFLFILPPVFVLVGMGIQIIFEHLKHTWMRGAFLVLISAAGIYGLLSNHPYQYTYYNALVGGTAGAYRRYETDYWLTCYKEAMETYINPNPQEYLALHVLRAPSIAAYYAVPQVKVISFDPGIDQPVPGQKTLLTTRTNVDLSFFPDSPVLFNVGLPGADFCVVKQNN